MSGAGEPCGTETGRGLTAPQLRLLKEIRCGFYALSAQMPRKQFLEVFIGTMASVVGNMPPVMWEEMVATMVPCGKPGCECHILPGKAVEVLELLRQDFQVNCPRVRNN